MQDLFTLSLEKDLHAGKLEDTVIFFIARHIKKKKLVSEIFQGTCFRFVFH